MMRVDREYVRQSREECRVLRGNLKHQLQIAYALHDAAQKPTFVHDPPREMVMPACHLSKELTEHRLWVVQCKRGVDATLAAETSSLFREAFCSTNLVGLAPLASFGPKVRSIVLRLSSYSAFEGNDDFEFD